MRSLGIRGEMMFEKVFKLSDNGTNFRAELLAGVTTNLTMAYIKFVNPAILSETGMDKDAAAPALLYVACLMMSAVKGDQLRGCDRNMCLLSSPARRCR